MLFALLTLFSALSLAAVAGWFSIVGFMTIYAGAPMYALIMGAVTECAKLVTTSWLYRNWEYADWKLKGPLLYFTIALMTATSIGVFGFLSKAHLEQGASTLDSGAKIEELNYQINREKAVISDNEKVIAQLDATVNSFLGKERTDRALSVRKSQSSQRKQLQEDSADAQKRIDDLNKQKFKLESEVRKLQLEVGPIRYIAELIYNTDGDSNKNIEAAVRLFTLLIVSTLDPLAVILLIAANHTLIRLRREKENKASSDTITKHNQGVVDVGHRKIDKKGTEIPEAHIQNIADNEINAKTESDKEKIEVPPSILQETNETLNETKEELVPLSQKNIQDMVESSSPEQITDITTQPIQSEPNQKGQLDQTVPSNQENQTEKDIPVEEKIPDVILNEVKKTTLDKIKKITAIPGARNPNVTSVLSSESGDNKNNKEEVLPAGQIEPWAQQETVLRELLGFIPTKLNEDNKPAILERTQEDEKETRSSSLFQETKESKKVYPEGSKTSMQNSKDEEIYEVEIPESVAGLSDKYPKALGWINVFRGN